MKSDMWFQRQTNGTVHQLSATEPLHLFCLIRNLFTFTASIFYCMRKKCHTLVEGKIILARNRWLSMPFCDRVQPPWRCFPVNLAYLMNRHRNRKWVFVRSYVISITATSHAVTPEKCAAVFRLWFLPHPSSCRYFFFICLCKKKKKSDWRLLDYIFFN